MDEKQTDDEYLFDFTKKQIVEVLDRRDLIRNGCYVPTRQEVATWTAAGLICLNNALLLVGKSGPRESTVSYFLDKHRPTGSEKRGGQRCGVRFE